MAKREPTLVDYAERGPWPVGVVELDLPDPRSSSRRLPTDVWYPAARDGFDDFPQAEHPRGGAHRARVGAPGATLSARPLISFSHGNAGFRRQSTFLTTHLASWGFVVTAPDHAGNTFFEMLAVEDEDERIRIHKEARANRPEDLAAAIAAVCDGHGAWPAVDASRIGALGHSYGGWTAFKMPRRDPRIAAVCGLAPASEPFVGKKAFTHGELPVPCPSLIVPALDDVLVDIETSIRPLHARLRGASMVGIRDADHFHFCDHLALIHGMHEKNSPRAKQTRATRPYTELLDEVRVQRLVRALVTGFFTATLLGSPSELVRLLEPDALDRLDPALARLEGVDAAGAPDARGA